MKINKSLASRAVVFVVLVFLIFAAFRYLPTAAVFASMAIISYAGVRSFARRVRSTRRLSLRETVRFFRGMRKSFAASASALALYAACFAIAPIAVCIYILTKSSIVLAVFIALTGILLCAATFLDWYERLKYALSISLLKTSAKWLMAFLATTTVFLSTVLAKQLTHSIAHVDPAFMPEFVRLVSAVAYPFALSAVLSVALTVLMSVQYVILFFGMLLSVLLKYLGNFSPPTIEMRLKIISYRAIHGKKPSIHLPWWERCVDGVQHFLRPIGTGAIAGIVIILGFAVIRLAENVPKQYLQTLLVMTEYRNPHLCENVSSTAHVAYLADGYVSVATTSQEKYQFSAEKCHK